MKSHFNNELVRMFPDNLSQGKRVLLFNSAKCFGIYSTYVKVTY